jgi:hypothetical protein
MFVLLRHLRRDTLILQTSTLRTTPAPTQYNRSTTLALGGFRTAPRREAGVGWADKKNENQNDILGLLTNLKAEV